MSVAQKALGDAAPTPAEAAAAWGHVVWCHERCHKSEKQALRSDLQEATLAAGGTLLCFKKAKQLGSWVQLAEPLPFILLTDWREVKPCMDEWWQVGTGRRPSFTVVVVEDPKLVGKVRAWAAALTWDKVHVLRGFGDAHALVASMVHCLNIKPKHVPAVAPRCGAPHAGGSALAGRGAGMAELQGKTPCGRPIEAAPQGAIAAGAGGMPFIAARAASLAAPVAAVLASICSSHTAEQLASMLTAQMPDHYED